MAPVAPKLQHEPHTAWSFTGVTAPKTNNNEANGQLKLLVVDSTKDRRAV